MTRIRGHPEFQREHEALEEILGQQWDLLGEDLADEGDELVVLVAQRRELRRTEKAKRRFLTEQQIGDTPHTPPKKTQKKHESNLEKVLRHKRKNDVDAVQDHVRGRHRTTGRRRALVLATEHLIWKTDAADVFNVESRNKGNYSRTTPFQDGKRHGPPYTVQLP